MVFTMTIARCKGKTVNQAWKRSYNSAHDLGVFHNFMKTRLNLIFALLIFVSWNTSAGVSAAPQAGYTLADAQNRPVNPVREGSGGAFHISLKIRCEIQNNPVNEKLTVTLPIPPNTDSQNVASWEVTPPPLRIDESRFGYRFAAWELGPGYPGEKFEVRYEADVELFRVLYKVDPNLVGAQSDIPGGIRADYTNSSHYYDYGNPVVREFAEKAVGAQSNFFLKAAQIRRAVKSLLSYEKDRRIVPASATLRDKKGSCSEHSFLMIAMMRSQGIPARYIGGSVDPISRGQSAGADRSFHKIVEVYIPRYGWIPMESTGGGSAGPEKEAENSVARCHGNMFNFLFEPEQGPIQLDPRSNTATVTPSGAKQIRYKSSIIAEWKTLSPAALMPH
jgi:transglutaminase-like putative cysteine protease